MKLLISYYQRKRGVFLQTINGLKNAADLRKLKLYDLFLLNSIDVESGTINPSIAAESKFFRNDWQRNENKRKSGFINLPILVAYLQIP